MWLISKCANHFIRIFFLLITFQVAYAEQCTYETWDWDSVQKKSVNHRKVSKLKSELTKEERGETDKCTVCEEDQIEVQIESLPSFKICKQLEDKMKLIRNIGKEAQKQ